MDLAFVGSEIEWRELSRWFGSSSAHRVVTVLPEPQGRPWEQWPESAERCEDFEALLADPATEVVLLTGPIAARPARLRRTARAGRLCLCAHPADLDPILYHEVSMMAEETGAVLVPLLPGRRHPAWRRLRTMCQSGAVGTLQAVRIERVAAEQEGRELVAGAYAEAAELLVSLIGEVVELTTTGDLAAGRLVVQHRSRAGLLGEVRLVGPFAEVTGWTVRVEGDRGVLGLDFPQGLLERGRLLCSGQEGTQHWELDAVGPGHDLIAEGLEAVQGRSDFTTWTQATEAAELADSAWQSLERRRSVEVYRAHRDELAGFKGTMTTCGCGLLWLALAGTVLLASARGLGIPGLEWLPVALMCALVVFLLLQALRWVFPRTH